MSFKTVTSLIGKMNGLCNRKDCRSIGANWFNHSTKTHYCRKCAWKINEFEPNLCTEIPTEKQIKQWMRNNVADYIDECGEFECTKIAEDCAEHFKSIDNDEVLEMCFEIAVVIDSE